MKSPTPARGAGSSPSDRVAAFIGKFDPKVGKLIRACRVRMRKLLPAAIELVYDNYNFFVIGYSATERASDCIVSIAAASNGVILSFYRGASVPDPRRLLLGAGKQNRFIRLPSTEPLKSRAVLALIRAAAAHGKTRLPTSTRGYTVIKSIAKKQRPRRKPEGVER